MIRSNDAATKFYTTEKLTGNLELTPEGFLLCRNVPLARTGSMMYGPGETDLEVGPTGYVQVACDADELFRPETIASFNGKPVLNEHPDNEDHGVGPDNYRDLTRGTILNPHKGDETLLAGDLLIADQDAIEDVLGISRGSLTKLLENPEEIKRVIQEAGNRGKREVSCGYEADYEQLEPGKGRKANIIGNHVALVESGRCGSRCKINDHLPERTRKMSKKTLADRIRKAFSTNDKKSFDEIMENEVEPMTGDEGGEGVHVHLHTGGPIEKEPVVATKDEEPPAASEGNRSKFTDEELENRFKTIGDALEEIKGKLTPSDPGAQAGEGEEVVQDEEGYVKPKEGATMKMDSEIEGELEEEAPEGTGDAAKKANDSAYLVESFRDTAALAEIIAPGVKLPTFDKAWHPKVTVDNICRLRKAALTKALTNDGTRQLITDARGGRTTDASVIKKLTCDSTRVLFNTVGAAQKRLNNEGLRRNHTNDSGRHQAAPKIQSIADMNKKNSEFYAKQ
jgi:uncharacterized protein